MKTSTQQNSNQLDLLATFQINELLPHFNLKVAATHPTVQTPSSAKKGYLCTSLN